jgi:predicted nucleic acid-binding protein
LATQVTVVLDSCVVIDVLRQHQSATDFVIGLLDRPFLSVVTISELRAGQRGERGERDRQRIDGLLASSRLLDVDPTIAEIAGGLLRGFHKSHAIDIADALIAATAMHHGLQLATLNLKHFPMFPDLKRAY